MRVSVVRRGGTRSSWAAPSTTSRFGGQLDWPRQGVLAHKEHSKRGRKGVRAKEKSTAKRWCGRRKTSAKNCARTTIISSFFLLLLLIIILLLQQPALAAVPKGESGAESPGQWYKPGHGALRKINVSLALKAGMDKGRDSLKDQWRRRSGSVPEASRPRKRRMVRPENLRRSSRTRGAQPE